MKGFSLLLYPPALLLLLLALVVALGSPSPSLLSTSTTINSKNNDDNARVVLPLIISNHDDDAKGKGKGEEGKEGKTECDVVYEGDFYANGEPINYWGFRGSNVIEREVIMDPRDAEYLFPPTNANGTRCQSSWNKLYGSSRCGYLHPHHEDSDRFVWRRHTGCLIFNGSYVEGVKPNCSEANLVQVAAYAYDDSHKPFENASLLTMFETALTVNETYTLSITFTNNSAVYDLMTSVAQGKKLLETHTINHTYCKEWDHGYMLGLYFGGICPAPQEVGICYNIIEQ